jgi:hypothetical protein
VPSSDMLDAIATVILAGMMLIPGINILVGIIVGGGWFGVSGGFAGAALAVLIMLAEKDFSDRHPLGSIQATPSAQIVALSDHPRWRPAPAFEEDKAISVALSKLAARPSDSAIGGHRLALAS